VVGAFFCFFSLFFVDELRRAAARGAPMEAGLGRAVDAKGGLASGLQAGTRLEPRVSPPLSSGG
jgi:hypothetical protein